MKRTPTSRTEALALIAKRQHNKEIGSEDHLQVACVNAFANKYPEKRGRLFATFQNPTDVTQTNIWIAKGLVAGVSDLIYIDDEFRIIGIELKQVGKRHSSDHLRRQIQWMSNNCYRAAFVTSPEMCLDFIECKSNGISCKFILDKLENNSIKSFVF